MFYYKKCSDVNFEEVYEAFKIGFSDYIIKIDVSLDMFEKRFFGPEGNRLEHSFIAFDDQKPVGLILGGIKVYEGIRTLRCGTLCIHPDYRGTEVSHTLFKLHKELALENKCKQLFLEVIVGNDRAIKYYRKKGYVKVYDIDFFTLNNPQLLQTQEVNPFLINQIDFNQLSMLQSQLKDNHINWQNDFDYLKQIDDCAYYGVFKDSNLIGGLNIHPNGKVSFLWTHPDYRYLGLAKKLIHQASIDLNIAKLRINFPNNMSLMGFVQHLGFDKDELTQYEMIHTL